MDYKDYMAKVNLLVNPDGSLQTYSGITVDMATAHEKYRKYLPQANKYLNPDGSIATLSSILGIVDGVVPQDVIDAINLNTVKTAAHEDKIQNCVQSLDSSIVAYIGPQGISSNVAGSKDSINVGNNIIESPEASFIFTTGAFYIGEGYENLFQSNIVSDDGLQKIKKLEDGWYRYSYKGEVTSWTTKILQALPGSLLGDYYAKLEVRNYKKTLGSNFKFKLAINGEKQLDITGNGKYEFFENGDGWIESRIGAMKGEIVDIEFDFRHTIAKKVNKVPFVSVAFRGGEYKTADSYNETDYTIISLDEAGAEQEYFIDGDGKVNFHLAADGVTKINSITKFMGVFKKLTAENKAKQIEIIKSGIYTAPVEMQGTTFPVEDMLRRADKYGIVAPPIKVTDINRDLWYVEEGEYEVKPTGGQWTSVEVASDGTISDGTLLENVDGSLRMKSAGKIRKEA